MSNQAASGKKDKANMLREKLTRSLEEEEAKGRAIADRIADKKMQLLERDREKAHVAILEEKVNAYMKKKEENKKR